MAFNLANFLGGYQEQKNIDDNRALQQQQINQAQQRIDNAEKTGALQRQALQSQLDDTAAQKKAQNVLAQNLNKVGDTQDVQTTGTVTGQVPALLASPELQASQTPSADTSDASTSPASSPRPAPASPSIPGISGLTSAVAGNVSTPQPVPFSVGGVTAAKSMPYMQSDALRDTARELAQDPATAPYAVKAVQGALALRHDEAFNLAAQTGDLTAAEQHLRGTDNVSVVQAPNGALAVKDNDGNVLDTYANKNEYLQQLAAKGSPSAMANYQKLLDTQERQKYQDAMKAQNDQFGQIMRGVDLQLRAAKLGQGNGSRSASGSGGADSADKQVASDIEAAMGKPSEANNYDTAKAGYLLQSLYQNNASRAPDGTAVLPNKQRTLMALRTAMTDPSQISIQADPQTGELGGYVNSLGGKMKIASVDQLQNYPGLMADKDGDKVVPATGDRLKQKITEQSSAARSAWIQSPNGQNALHMVQGYQEDGEPGLTSTERQALILGKGPISITNQDGTTKQVDASQVVASRPDLRSAAQYLDDIAKANAKKDAGSVDTSLANSKQSANEYSAANMGTPLADSAKIAVGGVRSWFNNWSNSQKDMVSGQIANSITKANSTGAQISPAMQGEIQHNYDVATDAGKKMIFDALTPAQRQLLNIK